MKKKIKLLFHGGLGNQLFQYCFYLKNYKNKKHNVKFFFNNDQWLNNKNSNINSLININILNYGNDFKSKLVNIIKNLFYYEVNDFNSNKLLNNKSRIFLNGYFQSKNCHRSHYKVLSKHIFDIKIKKILSKKKVNYCSLAIRRYDFVKLGWAINLSYYYKALKKLKIRKNKLIKNISEDEEFSKLFAEKLKAMGYNCEFLKNKSNEFNKSLNDFINLINSKNLIMANSSFSWWAANIRAHTDFDNKNVSCPLQWFPKNYKSNLNVTPIVSKDWKIVTNSF